MWAISFLAFLANPVVGTILLCSAAITTGIKVAAVDRQYAKRGETPPTARLVEKWLDSRAAKGAKPQKVKPYGSWAYARQRWQAMWEDLGEKHREQRAAHKAAVAEAKRTGQPIPVKPKLKDKLAGWKWSIPNLVAPVGQRQATTRPQPGVADRPTPAADGPIIACDECGATLIDTDGGYQHPTGSTCPKASPARPTTPPSAPPDPAARLAAELAETRRRYPRPTAACPACRKTTVITSSGWCEPCTANRPHGFCPVSDCKGIVRLDNGEWVHGAHWPCQHRESAAGHTTPCAAGCGKQLPMHPSMAGTFVARCANCRNAPTSQRRTAQPSAPASSPAGQRSCARCDSVLAPSMGFLRGAFCPRCQATRVPAGHPAHRGTCERCGLPGYGVIAHAFGGRTESPEFLHDANESTVCPQVTAEFREFRRADPDAAREYDEIVDGQGWVDEEFAARKHRYGEDCRRPYCDFCCRVRRRPNTAGTSLPQPVPSTEGEPMTTTTQQSGEVTGTRSAVAYATRMAEVHGQHAGNEGFLTSLANMEVGDGDIGLVREAMQASQLAGAKWQAAADSIEKNNAALREHYANTPDAASKEANIRE